MNKKYVKFIIKVVISMAFLYWVIVKTNWPDFLLYVRKISPIAIIFYIAVLILGMVISSYKWKLLADYKNIRLPHKEFFKLYLTGTFINNFMPSFVAGDAYKAYAIAKIDQRYSEAASTVVMDRITGLVGAMILALVFSLINIRTVIQNNVLIITNVLIILSLGLDFLIAQLRKNSIAKKWAFLVLPTKAVNFLKDLYSYSRDRRVIRKSVVLGFIFSIVSVAFLNYILFQSLGIKVSLLNYLSVIFLISIVSALPITINNIGLKEWAYVTFFGLFSVSAGAVVAVSIISRFLQMLVSFVALPIYLKSKK